MADATFRWTAADLTRPKSNGNDIERQKSTDEQQHNEFVDAKILIDDTGIFMPSWLELEPEERSILEVLELKLNQSLRQTGTKDTDETRVS